MTLSVKNLEASINDQQILRGVNLDIQPGTVHVIMGPNGSGKSTLANVLMGHPKYEVSAGTITFGDHDLTSATPEARAQAGLFLAFQYPREISGVPLDDFLFTAYKNLQTLRDPQATPLTVFDFQKKLTAAMERLGMNPALASRGLNEGFSGGEKKKAEMVQLDVLEPTLAILDETDSGLDVDALQVVGEAIHRFRSANRSVLMVTHYQRILKYLQPDVVHIMIQGRIVATGGPELATQVEHDGFAAFLDS